jgi:hypothetical protein
MIILLSSNKKAKSPPKATRLLIQITAFYPPQNAMVDYNNMSLKSIKHARIKQEKA